MKTKFVILIILVSLTATIMAGCSNATATISTSNGLSTAAKLALGTLKLEGTSQAVTAAEASQLVTLWEGYESLANSDTTSPVELDALVKQIEDTLTPAQIKAIEAMNLSQQSVNETLSTLASGQAAGSTTGTPSASAQNQTNSSGAQGSGMPAGSPAGAAPAGMPSGGDGMGDITGGVSGGISAQSTPSATQSAGGTGVEQVNPILLQALIHLLEARSQTTG